MKKAGIIVLALLIVLLAGCAAGNSSGKDIPPTEPPASETPATPDLPEETPSAPELPEETKTPSAPERPEETDVVFDIEGTQETMTLQKYTGGNFSVYIDKANFTAEESAQEVTFILTNPDPKTYPDVSITISYEEGASIKEKKDALSGDGAYTYEGEREFGEQTALWFHAKPEADGQWDSPTQDIYLIDGEDGFFTITVSYYLEASEGWGARMSAMIGTFLPA